MFDKNRLFNRVSKAVSLVTASVVDHKDLDAGIHQVELQFNKEISSFAQIESTVSNMFNNNARAIKNSFRHVKSQFASNLFVGYVVSNKIIKPANDSTLSGLTQCAKNVYMDDLDNSMWSRSTDEAGNSFIVKQESEDLSKLFALATVRTFNVQKLDSMSAGQIVNREFVAFVDPETASMSYGFACGSDSNVVTVVPIDTFNPQTVDIANVVEVANIENAEEIVALLTRAEKELAGTNSEMYEYYQQVYGYDDEYFKKFAEIIDSHGF